MPEQNGSADPAAVGHQAHREQIGAFLDAIANDREPELSGEEARKSLEIVLAVYESAKTGREVSLPLAAIPA
jgi:predicted dehydrogenase